MGGGAVVFRKPYVPLGVKEKQRTAEGERGLVVLYLYPCLALSKPRRVESRVREEKICNFISARN